MKRALEISVSRGTDGSQPGSKVFTIRPLRYREQLRERLFGKRLRLTVYVPDASIEELTTSNSGGVI
ncbi:hypothetical protein FACS18948_4620 [Clostridia bacterium]|nr:hypothetical protein FACS18948_4620 [Clostridia bacterium]